MIEDTSWLQGFSVRQVRVMGNLTSAIVCRSCGKYVVKGKKNLKSLEDAYLAALNHECKKVVNATS